MPIAPHLKLAVRTPAAESDHVAFRGITLFITLGLIGVFIRLPDMAAATAGGIGGSHPFPFLAAPALALASERHLPHAGLLADPPGDRSGARASPQPP